MYLYELIEALEKAPQDKVIPFGFHNPHSYRGYYDQLAFEPTSNIKVSDMLDDARAALGETYTGYKGGEFTMSAYTRCWIANRGSCGDPLSKMLLNYIIWNTHGVHL